MRQWVLRLWLVAGAILTAPWLLSVPASCQVQSSPAVPPERSQIIPDEKLDAAAAALERVANVRQDYQQRIEAAPPSESDKIADQARDALMKAITDQGLTVEEYVSILRVAENDPAVRDKIVKRIQPPAK